jgi:hypothetical protein
MKDLIEKILGYLPQYLADFGSLVSGPKRFIAQKNTVAEDTFVHSLLFLGISLVLVVLMTAPLLPPGEDLWAFLAMSAVTSLLAVSLYAVALRIAWRLVGGKATVRSFFVTYAYFFSVFTIVFTVVLLVGEGFFKVSAPELYRQVIDAKLKKQPMPDLSGSSVPLNSLFILVGGWLLIGAWGFIAWGAYRQLNGLSKWRSFFALTISGLLAWPISEVVTFVESAMMAK